MKSVEVFQSISAWQRLSNVVMRPAVAFKILRYTKEVGAEHEHIEKQRIALAYEISGTKEGEEVKIEPNTPEAMEFSRRFNEVLFEESALKPIVGIDLEMIVDALAGKDDVLSVSDLAALEPFFQSNPPGEDTA